MTRVLPSLYTALLLSGLGHVVHNVAEFGPAILVRPETLVPLAATALLLAGASRPSRAHLVLAGTWGLVVLVAGGGSVLPLALLPFEPAQTVGHYLAHLAYAALQVPLLVVVIRQLRRQPRPELSAH